MIIKEFKIDSTLIRFDDRDVNTKEKNKELVNILISLVVNKIIVD